MSGLVRLKRIYAPASAEDGVRVLVDRIWPRGVPKAKAHVEVWMKDLAPSGRLRKWYGHRPELWPEFRRRYLAELAENPMLSELQALVGRGDVTLLYAAHDEARNNAVVLAGLLGRSDSDDWRPAQASTVTDRPLGTPRARHHMQGMDTRARRPLSEDQLKAKAVARWENEGGAPVTDRRARTKGSGSAPSGEPEGLDIQSQTDRMSG